MSSYFTTIIPIWRLNSAWFSDEVRQEYNILVEIIIVGQQTSKDHYQAIDQQS